MTESFRFFSRHDNSGSLWTACQQLNKWILSYFHWLACITSAGDELISYWQLVHCHQYHYVFFYLVSFMLIYRYFHTSSVVTNIEMSSSTSSQAVVNTHQQSMFVQRIFNDMKHKVLSHFKHLIVLITFWNKPLTE